MGTVHIRRSFADLCSFFFYNFYVFLLILFLFIIIIFFFFFLNFYSPLRSITAPSCSLLYSFAQSSGLSTPNIRRFLLGSSISTLGLIFLLISICMIISSSLKSSLILLNDLISCIRWCRVFRPVHSASKRYRSRLKKLKITFAGPPQDVESPVGPYPILERRGEQIVPVVTAYAFAKYLGKLVLTFDGKKRLISAVGGPVLLDHNIAQGKTISRIKVFLN